MASPTAFQILRAAESSVARSHNFKPNALAETIAAWLESVMASADGMEFVLSRIEEESK